MFMPTIQKLKFFQDKMDLLTRKDLVEIIMNMKYQFREAGEAVFYQGDEGERLLEDRSENREFRRWLF